MNAPVIYMTAEELSACCADLSWGASALARATNIRLITVNRWFNGTRRVPPPIADVIRRRAAFARANPFPEDNRTGAGHDETLDGGDNPTDLHHAAGGVRAHTE
jgi:hypothetical protein